MKINREYKNILVFNPSFIGDTVLTTPLLRALRKLYPKARITFCVRDNQSELFINIPIIDEVISFNKRSDFKGIKGVLKFADILSGYNFDLVINIHKSLRSSALLLLTKKETLVGFRQASLSFLFDKKIHRDMRLHEAERNLSLLSLLTTDFNMDDAKKLGGALTCHINKDILNKTKYYFSSVTSGKKVVGVAVGSVWKTKRYPAEFFAKAAEILYKKGYAVALFAAKGDEEAVEEFKNNFKYEYYDFAMKTTLGELPAFLAACDLVICNDSGTLHIAIAAGVPTVSIFGATVKALGFFPYDNKSVVIENNNLGCRPCALHGGKKCPRKHFKCMLDIDYNLVAQAAIKLIEEN